MKEEMFFFICPRNVCSSDFLFKSSFNCFGVNILAVFGRVGAFMKKNDFIVKVGVFSAIAFLLQLLGGMLPKISGFLEMEISDLPAVILSFAMGPFAGVMVELIKNVLHLFITTTGGVGEIANFVINSTLVLVCGLIYRRNKTRKNAVLALIFAVLFMSLASVLINVLVMLPLYMSAVPFFERFALALSVIAPFNLVRGTVLAIITILIYKKISGFLK